MEWLRDWGAPRIQAPQPLITITRVFPVGATDGRRQLHLTFSDNRSGIVDLARHVEFIGTLAPLADPSFFLRAYTDHGTVCWPGGIDMDATMLYHLPFEISIDRHELSPTIRHPQTGKAHVRQ